MNINNVTVMMLRKLAEEIGDCPNIESKTLGGKVWWDTIYDVEGWRVQVNKITKHARILDENDVRKAWGNADTMIEKLRRYNNDNFILRGDILGIRRKGGLYEHYAVYIGNNEVIHYAASGKDFGSEITVHKAPIDEFLGNDKEFFVLDFKEKYDKPLKINVPQGVFNSKSLIGNDIGYSLIEIAALKMIKEMKYHLYTPEETVKRAESRLGETKYKLAFNNCEHFAIWCKTGISESHQVNKILDAIINGSKVILYDNKSNI